MAREERGVAPRVGVTATAFAADEIPPPLSQAAEGAHVTFGRWQRTTVAAMLLGILVLGVLSPDHLFWGLLGVFYSVFVAGAAIRLAAILTPHRKWACPPLVDQDLPHYTLIVPLYREAEVASELVANLARLDYHRDRLQALIVLEADDLATRSAFHALDLPAFIQVLVAPPGEPRTKPRACNIALELAKGTLVVIYDAEDAPDPLQLREAAARFASEPADLACLQAPLRIETPRHLAFIAEQFRLEYAALFQVLLPAYARWGLPFPLGGTSNHFKIEALRAVGGWDAYNVTEDADIGFRLASAGYRLDVIERPTLETAPTSLDQWGPQRARWIKGHLQTLSVHARGETRRQPRALLALIMTLGVPIAASNLHAPAMLIAGVGVAVNWMADGELSVTLADLTLYMFGWSVSAACAAIGLRRSGEQPRFLHLFGMVGYWMMWIFASPRAVWQFFFAPHQWDKTTHAPRTGRPTP
ncbi:MAG: family 2 glycosyl transferase [Caulobacter sp. 32-67-35]|nr:MAG: family 2 glycosyl transferase [Caulobacter sp. 32-67-35]